MEIEIIKFLQSFRTEFLDNFFKSISILGSVYGFIVVFICLFIFCDTVYSYFFAGSYGLIWLFNELIKSIVNRPRPYLVSSEVVSIMSAHSSSFPSGHTTSTVVMVMFLLYLIWRKKKGSHRIFKRDINISKSLKIIFTILLVVFTVLLMVSRMYLGQHFLSDVIVAFVISGGLSIFALYIYEKRNNIYLYFKGKKK